MIQKYNGYSQGKRVTLLSFGAFLLPL
uniref:Uncharacterized protein n=1 Tax=Arundo donax TaxID=35708 RepID=A0A0A9ENZ5_ARUDO